MIVNCVKNIIKKFICWILLLQTINVSIDPRDLKQFKDNLTNKEDLSINEIESIYELISEGVFHKDVPESDENDIETTSEAFELYFFTSTYTKLLVFNSPVEHYSFCQNKLSVLPSQPHLPPPEQV